MRTRHIRAGFFTDEDLAECSPWARLMFAGLWCLADREGRLEDRPRRIKAQLFPFDDVSGTALLEELEKAGKIKRYSVDDLRIIQVVGFKKHQRPHDGETASIFPDSPSETGNLGRPEGEPKSPGGGNLGGSEGEPKTPLTITRPLTLSKPITLSGETGSLRKTNNAKGATSVAEESLSLLKNDWNEHSGKLPKLRAVPESGEIREAMNRALKWFGEDRPAMIRSIRQCSKDEQYVREKRGLVAWTRHFDRWDGAEIAQMPRMEDIV